jgi:hypothetical protein
MTRITVFQQSHLKVCKMKNLIIIIVLIIFSLYGCKDDNTIQNIKQICGDLTGLEYHVRIRNDSMDRIFKNPRSFNGSCGLFGFNCIAIEVPVKFTVFYVNFDYFYLVFNVFSKEQIKTGDYSQDNSEVSIQLKDSKGLDNLIAKSFNLKITCVDDNNIMGTFNSIHFEYYDDILNIDDGSFYDTLPKIN